MVDKKCVFRLLFEQSGNFKKVINSLGYQAFDYDIQNEYGNTDFIIDLFDEINKCYDGLPSIFDSFNEYDYLFAFFPCIRFEQQILMFFRGDDYACHNWSMKQKLQYNIKIHDELNLFYKILSKLVCICIDRNFKLVIENPYSSQHYLYRYWCLKPTVIDYNRAANGDYFKKPTMFYFVNFDPCNCFIKADFHNYDYQTVDKTTRGKKRSELSLTYIKYFLSRYIFDYDYISEQEKGTQMTIFDL